MSSYGGILRYEVHSETQRGDVFIPTESRPDVLLQVVDGGVTAGGRRAQSSLHSGQPGCWRSPGRVPPQGNQMSITFLEPVYPAPGHVHRGQLQLVEVSRAGLGAQVPPGPCMVQGRPEGAPGCCACSPWWRVGPGSGMGQGTPLPRLNRGTFFLATGGNAPRHNAPGPRAGLGTLIPSG